MLCHVVLGPDRITWLAMPWNRGRGNGQGSRVAATNPVPAPSAEPEPPRVRHEFAVVWRGYSRRQVDEYLNLELRWLTADRDAAVAMARKLTRLLNEARGESYRLRERFDRQSREPLSPEAVAERLRRHVEIAHAEASDIVTRARARAEHVRVEALRNLRDYVAACRADADRLASSLTGFLCDLERRT